MYFSYQCQRDFEKKRYYQDKFRCHHWVSNSKCSACEEEALGLIDFVVKLNDEVFTILICVSDYNMDPLNDNLGLD